MKAGSEAIIRISWVVTLAWEGEALRFQLPTTVSPRYTPHSNVVEIGQPDGRRRPLVTKSQDVSRKLRRLDEIANCRQREDVVGGTEGRGLRLGRHMSIWGAKQRRIKHVGL